MTIQTHLNTKETINFGSFYTPDSIVCLVYQMLLDSRIDIKDYVLLIALVVMGVF